MASPAGRQITLSEARPVHFDPGGFASKAGDVAADGRAALNGGCKVQVCPCHVPELQRVVCLSRVGQMDRQSVPVGCLARQGAAAAVAAAAVRCSCLFPHGGSNVSRKSRTWPGRRGGAAEGGSQATAARAISSRAASHCVRDILGQCRADLKV